MANYATEQDALDLYGLEILLVGCDRDRDGVLDAGLFDRFAEIATNEIDGYLVGRDDLPLDPVPPQIKIYCIDIAIYRSRPTADLLSEEIKDRYKAAIRYLESVQRNKQRLVIRPTPDSVSGAVNGAVQAETSSVDLICAERRFTRDKLGAL